MVIKIREVNWSLSNIKKLRHQLSVRVKATVNEKSTGLDTLDTVITSTSLVLMTLFAEGLDEPCDEVTLIDPPVTDVVPILSCAVSVPDEVLAANAVSVTPNGTFSIIR